MEIIEITPKEYQNYFQYSFHVFNSSLFNELNSHKCTKVHYLAFKDSKVRIGIILGEKENSLHSPFSAPFGGFSFIKSDVKLQYIESAIHKLSIWFTNQSYDSLNITLPPSIYHNSFISKQINCFLRSNFQIKNSDLNYSFDLIRFNENYEKSILWRNARKNLSISFKKQLSFFKCNTLEEKEIAFSVIKQNREERGFPLRMNFTQIVDTIEVVKADFFIVKTINGEPAAAAMIFYISSEIVQVIYWGDLPVFSNLKTMNFLSYHVFKYYKNNDIRIVDIGPSTENSIPSYGLCEFKESIGCSVSTKFSFHQKK